MDPSENQAVAPEKLIDVTMAGVPHGGAVDQTQYELDSNFSILPSDNQHQDLLNESVKPRLDPLSESIEQLAELKSELNPNDFIIPPNPGETHFVDLDFGDSAKEVEKLSEPKENKSASSGFELDISASDFVPSPKEAKAGETKTDDLFDDFLEQTAPNLCEEKFDLLDITNVPQGEFTMSDSITDDLLEHKAKQPDEQQHLDISAQKSNDFPLNEPIEALIDSLDKPAPSDDQNLDTFASNIPSDPISASPDIADFNPSGMDDFEVKLRSKRSTDDDLFGAKSDIVSNLNDNTEYASLANDPLSTTIPQPITGENLSFDASNIENDLLKRTPTPEVKSDPFERTPEVPAANVGLFEKRSPTPDLEPAATDTAFEAAAPPADDHFKVKPTETVEDKPNVSASSFGSSSFDDPRNITEIKVSDLKAKSDGGSLDISGIAKVSETTTMEAATAAELAHSDASTPAPPDNQDAAVVDDHDIGRLGSTSLTSTSSAGQVASSQETESNQPPRQQQQQEPHSPPVISTSSAVAEVEQSKMGKKNYRREVSTENEVESGPDCVKEFFSKLIGPNAAEVLYWRDPKKSGVVFAVGLIILFSLTIFSIISVVAYTLFFTLLVTLSFRIYKNVLQAVQKTNEGHPFKDFLEVDITPPDDKVHEIVSQLLVHVNCALKRLRSVIFVEDIIDSLKYLLIFWCLTYIGSMFNGLTLVILAYIGCFSLPKVYEMNQTQIDQQLSVVAGKINEVKEKLPFLKKADEKKDD